LQRVASQETQLVVQLMQVVEPELLK